LGEEGGSGGMNKMGEGEWEVQASGCRMSKSDKNGRYSIGNRDNGVVSAFYGDKMMNYPCGGAQENILSCPITILRT